MHETLDFEGFPLSVFLFIVSAFLGFNNLNGFLGSARKTS